MKYTYQDIPDKSKEGIIKEVQMGLAKIAFHFVSVLGIPREVFDEMLKEKCPDNLSKLSFYLHYRNENPNLFA